MAVPKQKHTKSRRNKRRGNIYIRPQILVKCPKCGKPVLPYSVCLNCGYYKGREVIDVLKKLTRKERKAREKELAAKEKAEKQVSGKEKPLTWEGLSKK